MLTHLDHIVLLTGDFKTAVEDYKILLGRPPVLKSSGDYETANFPTGNTSLEIMAPTDQETADRAKTILGDEISRLTSLAFRCGEPLEAHRLLQRRGAQPNDISNRGMFRCSDTICAGVKTFVLPPADIPPVSGLRLDHLVINTPNPDRAIAHYGARLGIRFALDRTIEQFQTRFLFFKLDDVVLEVIHRLSGDNDPLANDEIWGLTWKCDDLNAERQRLTDQGVNVSEIRTGRKPGTQVFTVKSHSGGIPTLFLSQAKI